MRAAASLVAGTLCGVAMMSTTAAAPVATSRPSISIISPAPGAVIRGSALSLHVRVVNFRLVQPILVNPPILKGNAGHIHYVIDGHPAFAQSAATSYTWTSVAPGRHTLTAYLATSQHAPFPGVKSVSVMVNVAAPAAPRATARPVPEPTHGPGIGHAPTTGGAADVVQAPLNISLLLAGFLSIILGLLFLTTRFGAFFGGRQAPSTPANSEPANVSASPTAEQSDNESEPVTEGPSDLELATSSSDHVPPSTRESPEEGILSMPYISQQECTSDEAMPVPVNEVHSPATLRLPSPASSLPDTGTTRVDVETAVSPASAPIHGAQSELRTQAVAMVEQWSTVVDGLINQLNQQDEERRGLLARIEAMEQALEADRALRERLQHVSRDAVVGEELQKLRYVTNSLIEDPDHIVVLAAVAQHAGPLKQLVEDYARIRSMIESG